jgi:uncharacterized protein
MVVHEMTRNECLEALTPASFGRLACACDNQPYIVPFYFVYREPYLYGFTTVGQKLDWMRSNPHVCVEVDDVSNPEQWKSVLVFGQYEEVQEPAPELVCDQEQLRALAHRAWQPIHPGLAGASATEERQLHMQRLHQDQPLMPTFYRIRIDRITGRQAKPALPMAEQITPGYQ